MAPHAFGIDVGGSGIKGALVNIKTGAFISERFYAPTPPQATPEDIATLSRTMLAESGCDVDIPVGIAVPAPVVDGVVSSMANLSQEWAGTDAASLFAEATGRRVCVLNDADAAGMAEARFGGGETQDGTVIVFTLGTGIGSAVFSRGVLVSNTELGHISLDNGIADAEKWASASARSRENLSLDEWAERLDVYPSILNAFSIPMS